MRQGNVVCYGVSLGYDWLHSLWLHSSTSILFSLTRLSTHWIKELSRYGSIKSSRDTGILKFASPIKTRLLPSPPPLTHFQSNISLHSSIFFSVYVCLSFPIFEYTPLPYVSECEIYFPLRRSIALPRLEWNGSTTDTITTTPSTRFCSWNETCFVASRPLIIRKCKKVRRSLTEPDFFGHLN